MRFGKLQGIDHAQHLIDITPQGQVIHYLVTYVTGDVDEEGATKGNGTVGGFDVVGLENIMGHIRHQGVTHLADTTVFNRGVAPGIMGKVAVDRDANHLDVDVMLF